MKINVRHKTVYSYDSEVAKSIQYLRLTPRNLPHQQVHEWTLIMPRLGQNVYDGFGNYGTILTVNQPHYELVIEAKGVVSIDDSVDSFVDNFITPEVFLNSTELTKCTPELVDFAHNHTNSATDKNALIRLSEAILSKMPYLPGSTKVTTTAEQAFVMNMGVCQDHTHVFLACARHLGVPARYVSGYLVTDDEAHLSSHAWAQAYIDGAWHSFDVTNQMFAATRHVQLAVGRDYLDAAPVRGVRQGGGNEFMRYYVSVIGSQAQQ